ncbi:Uncharacterised protein [Vibrio cholerae]|nr:Uncharacterised protein [Vibrio cholerae]
MVIPKSSLFALGWFAWSKHLIQTACRGECFQLVQIFT